MNAVRGGHHLDLGKRMVMVLFASRLIKQNFLPDQDQIRISC